ANLSAYQASHPIAHPEPDDFEPDGTWYSMVAVRGDLYAVEPNHGEVLRISPDSGAISRVVDVSASQGHIVPTAIAYRGSFFLGNLGLFPVMPGTEKVFRLSPGGHLQQFASGLTTVLGRARLPRPAVRARVDDRAGRPRARRAGNRDDRAHRPFRRDDHDRDRPELPDRHDTRPC